MSADRVRREGPMWTAYEQATHPPEPYGRVTNPERFAPLHDRAGELLHELERQFDVQRIDSYGLDPELEQCPLALPTVKLLPRDSASAPILVVFTTFPGLHVRFGRWWTDSFPLCGCDACAETADGEGDRLKSLVESVVAGRFRESRHRAVLGTSGRAIGDVSQRIAGGETPLYEWMPWPRRR